MSESPKKGKSSRISAILNRVVYEYIADIPFEEAINAVEASSEKQKWQLHLFEKDEESRNYFIRLRYEIKRPTGGYQLRLYPWAGGMQSRVMLHEADYSKSRNPVQDFVIYFPMAVIFLAFLFVADPPRGMEPNLIFAVVSLLLLVSYPLVLFIYELMQHSRIGKIEHSIENENRMIEILHAVLGEAESPADFEEKAKIREMD